MGSATSPLDAVTPSLRRPSNCSKLQLSQAVIVFIWLRASFPGALTAHGD
jgi:hypothetical protein